MQIEKQKIRWGRVLAATLMAEVFPILFLFLVVAVYAPLTGSPDEARLNSFAKRAGNWVGPVAGSLFTFAFSLWACRKLSGGFVLHGALVGLLSTLIGVGLLVVLADEFSLVFVFSYLLRFSSAVAGGLVARKRFERNEGRISAGAAV